MERTTDARKALRGLFLAAAVSGMSACGGGGDGGGNPPPVNDFSVDAFSIAPVGNAAPDAAVLSKPVTLKGFNQPLNIHVENGEYCLNQDPQAEEIACSSTDGQVNANDSLMLRAVSSAEAGATVIMSVTIGNDNESLFGTDFFVTTRTLATLPDNDVVLAPVAGAKAGMTVSSDPVVIAGFNGAITASVATPDAMISVDGAAPVAGPVVIVAGQSVAIVTTVPADAEETHAVTLKLSDGENEAVSTFEIALRNSESVIDALPAITPQEGIEPGADFEFEPVTIEGDFATAPIRITGGEYRVNDGTFTSLEGVVSPDDEVTVRVVALEEFSRSHFARLTIGDGENATTTEFKVITEAEPEGLNRPDPFMLGSALGLQPGAEVTSVPVTLKGFTGELPLAVAADGINVLVAVNDGAFGTAPATVSAGAILRLKLIAPEAFGTEFTVDVHVGEEGEARQTGTWWLSTRTQDLSPIPFGFGIRTGLEPASVVTSERVTIRGFEGSLPVTIDAPAAAEAAFSIDNGGFDTSGNINAEQALTVRARAPCATATSAHTINVTVGDPENGGVTGTFILQSADVEPKTFAFTQPTADVEPNILVTSQTVVTGFDIPLPVSVTSTGTELAEVSVNGADFTSELDGVTISKDQTLAVRIHASAIPDGQARAVVRVGEGATAREAFFAATTRDFQPDTFEFGPKDSDGFPGQPSLSPEVTLRGFEGTLVARLQNAVFPDNSTVKTVSDGDKVSIKVTAPANIGEEAAGILHLELAENPGSLVSDAFIVQAADHEAPTVTVQYPTRKTLTNDDVVLVRGTYSDNHATKSVTVSGVDAELLDATRWQAELPLNPGENSLVVGVRDQYNNAGSGPILTVISERERFNDPVSFAVTANGTIVYVADKTEEGTTKLIRLNVLTGTQSVMGEYFHLDALALNKDDSMLYALFGSAENSPASILRINTSTGVESTITTLGEGQFVNSINYDLAPGTDPGPDDDWERLFITMQDVDGKYGLYGLELGSTNQLRTISKVDSQGAGETWSTISDVVFDHLNGLAYVTADDEGTIYAVSGIEADKWSTNGTGISNREVLITSPEMSGATSVLFDDDLGGRLFVLDATNKNIFKVSLGSSEPQIDLVSDVNLGGFVAPMELAFADGASALVLDVENRNGLVSVNLVDGIGVTIPEIEPVGSGEAMNGRQLVFHDQKVYFREGSSTIRSFSVADGRRGTVQYAGETSLPDLDAVDSILWGLHQTGTGSDLVWSVGTFNTSNTGDWQFELKHTFSKSEGIEGSHVLGGGLVIDGSTAYLLTRDGAGNNTMYAEPMGQAGSTAALVSEFNSGTFDTLVGFGQLTSNFFYVVTRTKVWAIDTIKPSNGNVSEIALGFTNITEVEQLDGNRLAVWDEATNQLVILHMQLSGDAVQVDSSETVIDMNLADDTEHPYRGYGPSAIKGLAYDAENQHLLGLNASGREVIVIDLGKIKTGENDDGTPIEVTSGQSLLISRGSE